MEYFGIDPATRQLLQESAEPSWFVMQYDEQVTRTFRGSQAGDPLGDITFSMGATLVLVAIRRKLLEEGLVTHLMYDSLSGPFAPKECDAQTPISDVSYVDDELFVGFAPSTRELLPKLATTTKVVHAQLRAHGLVPSFARGD